MKKQYLYNSEHALTNRIAEIRSTYPWFMSEPNLCEFDISTTQGLINELLYLRNNNDFMFDYDGFQIIQKDLGLELANELLDQTHPDVFTKLGTLA